MTTVTSATAATTTSTTSSSSTASSGLNTDYEMFLKLLTTQMTNQDPTDPMDSADYAVQLATFSQVEQQTKTNELLESLTAQLGLMGMSEYAGWVGMDARSESPAYFNGTDAVTISPNPAIGATNTVLVVSDAAGNEVARETIPVSADAMQWDGVDSTGNFLPAGNYTFNLESYNNGTLLSTDPVETYNRILEAQGTAEGAVLVLAGGATVGTGSISALRDAN
ncbi:flagellar basal-body rod modification protein FlgD [Rhodobacter aestuarii]|uniref:Basal-body rod modification protein FlgD n=1 Tax=Rhodobacter aestuarii TaxID=453582 RepID=A0A1N7LK01_9RHOB|nr:flagellar hook capping FlgD N-terminal domain-containing protein [Rhodobacter aestuarii]PTV95208.1 flagellar basal-body rod modification protein FlgD [Rhodobacter aestuarii]SIS74114.1 flagellar basal-body rod modification protein FlgD [Rhodobacter aestuarii]